MKTLKKLTKYLLAALVILYIGRLGQFVHSALIKIPNEPQIVTTQKPFQPNTKIVNPPIKIEPTQPQSYVASNDSPKPPKRSKFYSHYEDLLKSLGFGNFFEDHPIQTFQFKMDPSENFLALSNLSKLCPSLSSIEQSVKIKISRSGELQSISYLDPSHKPAEVKEFPKAAYECNFAKSLPEETSKPGGFVTVYHPKFGTPEL